MQAKGEAVDRGNDVVALDPGRILLTLRDLEGIGNRYHGTPGEATCRDYLAERFDSLGLHDTRLEAFSYLGYEKEACACRVLAPYSDTLDCRPVQFSASTDAEGEAVYLGNGEAADFARTDRLGIDLAGRVIVIHSIAPFLVAPFLAERNIAALLNISESPEGAIGNFTVTLHPPPQGPPWEGRPVYYPAVTVEAQAGRALLSAMSGPSPVVVRVEHTCRYVEKTAHNVVGWLPGVTREHVVVGGHYDSQAEGPCVWDNGTGCACILEIARVLAHRKLERCVTVVGFAVEEVGLCGSAAYVERHAARMNDVVGMVNLDAVASRFPAKRTVWADEAMREFACESAGQVGWHPEVVFDARRFQFSDNTPFTDAGVPSCWIWEYPPIHPFYHTARDVAEFVDPQAVVLAGGVSARVAQRLAEDSRVVLKRAEMAGECS